MGTNGGLTYHIHGSEYSSPEYMSQMRKKKELEHHSYDACREVLHFICQGVSYSTLVVVICSFGFVTSFEFLTYPLLLRKLTCNKNWSFFYETFLPSITLLANMLGSIIGGVFIDKLGRRPVFIIAALLALIAELIGFLSVETILFMTMRSMSSLTMGALYTTTLLYTIETCPVQHRLHVYLLHTLAQNIATTVIPLVIQNSPMDSSGGIWHVIPTVTTIILALGAMIGILFPEPSQSSKIRVNSRVNFQSKFSVMQLDNEDPIEAEPKFAWYSDMFYNGGKVVAILLMLLFLIGGFLTTSVMLTFPIVHDVGGACSASSHLPRPCAPSPTVTMNQMFTVFGCSFIGSLLGYIFVQRYGRKNSFRGPAAFRVIAVISMVLCSSNDFMLSQAGLIVVFTSIMNFTLDLYCLEVFAIRSRATSFGLLHGLKLLGIASAFLVNPTVLNNFSSTLRFSVYTIVGTLMFGCSLGLRKDTFVMALNIGEATVDIGL